MLKQKNAWTTSTETPTTPSKRSICSLLKSSTASIFGKTKLSAQLGDLTSEELHENKEELENIKDQLTHQHFILNEFEDEFVEVQQRLAKKDKIKFLGFLIREFRHSNQRIAKLVWLNFNLRIENQKQRRVKFPQKNKFGFGKKKNRRQNFGKQVGVFCEFSNFKCSRQTSQKRQTEFATKIWWSQKSKEALRHLH